MARKFDMQLFSLYLPPSMHKKLKRLAEKEYLPMTTFILKHLENIVKEEAK